MSEAVARLAQALRRLAAPHRDAAPFLALWPQDDGAPRVVSPRPLPVLGAIEALDPPGDPLAAEVLRLLAELAPTLAWHQTYDEAAVGRSFLDRYGWTEIVGRRGPFASEVLAAGLLLLGPDTLYPPHAHAAEEVYLPISGRADWLRTDVWAPVEPGRAIHHPPHVVHGTRTGAEPLLALYLWKGEGLDRNARLLPDGAA